MRGLEQNNVMLDLETLGTDPGDVILSISAINFNSEGDILCRFNVGVELFDSLLRGFKINADTLDWWKKQNTYAINLQHNLQLRGECVNQAMIEFVDWFKSNCEENTTVWGNGATMDIAMLKAYLKDCDISIPWEFYNERDVRTIVALNPDIKKNTVFEGTKHYGIDDCNHQIKYLVETLKSL